MMIRYYAAVFFCLLQLPLSSHAEQLEAPTGKVLLTVTGAIGVFTEKEVDPKQASEQQPSYEFDLPMLESLGLTKILTETPWTEGVVDFEGVLVRDVLETVKADGESVRAIALNDYVIELPIQDFIDHDVIIATRISGQPMKIRENGPLWIIYPWTENSELRRALYYGRAIWQLKSLHVIQ